MNYNSILPPTTGRIHAQACPRDKWLLPAWRRAWLDWRHEIVCYVGVVVGFPVIGSLIVWTVTR